jgi:hypothetical protein
MLPTTKSESLRAGRETLKARHWALWNVRGARGTLLNMKGTSFEAMVFVLRAEARRISKMSTTELIRNSWRPNHWPMRAARNHIYQKRDFTFFLQHATRSPLLTFTRPYTSDYLQIASSLVAVICASHGGMFQV